MKQLHNLMLTTKANLYYVLFVSIVSCAMMDLAHYLAGE